jgi:hypothetical protein
MGRDARQQFRITVGTLLIGQIAGLGLQPSADAATREVPSTASVQNANFVVSAPDLATAQAVLAKAESLRNSLAEQWLGERLPDGIAPTVIRVTLSADEDRGLTWVADRADRLSHIMWLTTSAERATGTTLAHEMSHVVLASRYPGQLAAWIDEGIASRQDDPRRATARREIIAWYAKTGNWPSLVEILSAGKIAGSDRGKYAISASLTDYLLTLGDTTKMLEFSLAGSQQGWDAALKTHYNIPHVRELESRWQRWVTR